MSKFIKISSLLSIVLWSLISSNVYAYTFDDSVETLDIIEEIEHIQTSLVEVQEVVGIETVDFSDEVIVSEDLVIIGPIVEEIMSEEEKSQAEINDELRLIESEEVEVMEVAEIIEVNEVIESVEVIEETEIIEATEVMQTTEVIESADSLVHIEESLIESPIVEEIMSEEEKSQAEINDGLRLIESEEVEVMEVAEIIEVNEVIESVEVIEETEIIEAIEVIESAEILVHIEESLIESVEVLVENPPLFNVLEEEINENEIASDVTEILEIIEEVKLESAEVTVVKNIEMEEELIVEMPVVEVALANYKKIEIDNFSDEVDITMNYEMLGKDKIILKAEYKYVSNLKIDEIFVEDSFFGEISLIRSDDNYYAEVSKEIFLVDMILNMDIRGFYELIVDDTNIDYETNNSTLIETKE